MFFIIIFLFFLLLLSRFLSHFKLGRVAIFLYTLIGLYCIFILINYTPDKQYYIFWIEYPELTLDKEPTFQIVAEYIRKHHYSYQFLHITFIGIYSLLYLYFVSRFSKNVYIITLLYIPLIFIFYGTQLRYFLGYYAVLLGYYYLLVAKKKMLALFCFIFAVCSHYSLLFFIPFYFLYQIKDNFYRRILRITAIVFAGYTLLTTVIFNLFAGIRFVTYLKGDLVSSFSGGLFSFGVLIPVYVLVNQYYKARLNDNPELINDSKFIFLYKFSLIPLAFLGIAITAQVIGHRFIMTGVLMPILFLFYRWNEIKNRTRKIRYLFFFIFTYIIIFVHFNFSFAWIMGEWEMVEEMQKMIWSNEILKDLLT